MSLRTTMSLGLSALMFGSLMVGCTTGAHSGIASARDAAETAQRSAARFASRAAKSLRRGETSSAIEYAEQAAASAPRVAGYRKLLADAYLQGGRFGSARQAYADAAELDPRDGKSALNLALCTIALGDSASARTILASSAAVIPAADLGLAMSVSGDAEAGIVLLNETARANRGAVQARQNLALSLALAGQWQAAKLVAERDLSADRIDRRMEQWAAFVSSAPSDQVAALLGVQPVADTGQPVALALRDVKTDHAAPVATAYRAERRAVAGPVPIPHAPVGLLVKAPGHIVFAAPHAVVQPLPSAAPKPTLDRSAPAIASRTDASSAGNWYVQVGAYQDAEAARSSWQRITRDIRFMAEHQPKGATYTNATGRFYRLSIGGFAREDGVSLCLRYRERGGACFVRRAAGDQIAAWANPGIQTAARGM